MRNLQDEENNSSKLAGSRVVHPTTQRLSADQPYYPPNGIING